jgi:hypothetical protein
MKRIKRDDTEHGFEYYWADEVDALLAQQKRPQNCGTGYCSCVECVVEPAPVQEPVAWVSVKDRLPPVGEDVLTYDVANPVDGFDCERRLGLDEWSVKYSVSHWMPIPAPPIEAAHSITAAPQPVPVKTYHDGKPWPVAPKPWVGLTDNEIALINADYPNPQGFARAIEAKLREKNGGAA